MTLRKGWEKKKVDTLFQKNLVGEWVELSAIEPTLNKSKKGSK